MDKNEISLKTALLERFLSYVSIDTQSKPESKETPSTHKQFVLAEKLKQELQNLGLQDITLTEQCYLYATLPTNSSQQAPTIGLIAHLDTSPDFSGTDVKPKVHKNYDGNKLIINEEGTMVLSTAYFPELKNYIGQTLITSDGTTLLGADDKAGVAAIMQAISYLQSHKEIEHGTIKIAFTPDEEIGRGANHFDVPFFGADYAYTIDGGALGELEYENFNAAGAHIEIQGVSVHPGYAYGKMINALLLASELINKLPDKETPATTKGYEGFYHVYQLKGDVSKASLDILIRDHDSARFDERKRKIQSLVNQINKEKGEEYVRVEISDQYYNMKEKIVPVMHIVEQARRAMEKAGVKPDIKPIRGGTDGARLSFEGLPCPNIFTGGHNFHGPYEYIPLESLEKACQTVINLCSLT